MAVVFNVYFAGVVARDTAVHGVSLWSFLIGISALTSGILSPLLGALADVRRTRKYWLAGCAVLGASSTSGLAIASPETLVCTCILFVMASISFTLSLTFYHSFLNDLSTEHSIGQISGFGWAIGYIGGGLCLTLNLIMIENPGWFRLPAYNHWPARASFFIVGIWWLLFTLPFLLWVKEPRDGAPPAAFRTPFAEAWDRVFRSIKSATRYHKNLFLFLVSYLLFNDVIETVIVMASIFAAGELGMNMSEVIGCFLMIQFVAFFGALGFGRLADRWSNKKSLQASLIVWAFMIAWTAVMRTKTEFWIAAVFVALILGGSQAVSRSLFGKLIPAGEEAQFYGFFGLSGKLSAAIGPFLFGVVHELTGHIRWAIFSMLVLLILGISLLSLVKEPASYDKTSIC